jgi:hypothetical protein
MHDGTLQKQHREIARKPDFAALHPLVEPFAPKVDGAGRLPIGLTNMLRM